VFEDTLVPPLPLGPGQNYGTQYTIKWYVDNNLYYTGPFTFLYNRNQHIGSMNTLNIRMLALHPHGIVVHHYIRSCVDPSANPLSTKEWTGINKDYYLHTILWCTAYHSFVRGQAATGGTSVSFKHIVSQPIGNKLTLGRFMYRWSKCHSTATAYWIGYCYRISTCCRSGHYRTSNTLLHMYT